jgi:hypothetical protein
MLHGIIARTNFEEKGVSVMEHCDKSMEQLEQAFNHSCTLCTLYHRTADCEACPIREAMLAKAKWHGHPMNYTWYQEEVALA